MEWNNKYNSFNSMKALVHVKYWEQVNEGTIPFPLFVSIDPMNYCNFKCPHCNAKEKLKDKDIMTVDIMRKIIDTLCKWGTKTVCVGGGGESTLNKNFPYLIKGLNDIDIDIGLVSNGSVIEHYEHDLDKFSWVGISMDAATEDTYKIMKGVEFQFEKVLNNIKKLVSRRTLQKTEITYKFLLHPNNYHEVYDSIKLAKELGCDLIHIRPGAYPWFDHNVKFEFTENMIYNVIDQIDRGRNELENDHFKVYGITHKFSVDWKPKKTFSKCYAGYTTCVIYPNGDVGMCCDRRGDGSLTLGNISEIDTLWGSQKHKDILETIKVSTCPRCTYSHINEIFENVILKDKTNYYFY